MKHLITIFLFLLITSCKKKQYQVESKFANGNNEIIYHSLNDTIIYGKTFSKKLRIKFNQKKDTLRKGIYINELALGEHLFYEKNVINWKRKYVLYQILILLISISKMTKLILKTLKFVRIQHI
jgi:hypothetical protein